jgi:TonB family protein
MKTSHVMKQIVATVLVGRVLDSHALFLGKPTFPVYARGNHISGRVVVKVIVDKDGKVLSAQVIEGPSVFREVSEESARRSTFSPAEFCGKPARVSGIITYNFVAQ